MYKQFFIFWLAASSVLSGSLFAQTNYSKLVVFGDSLSDTGNLAIVDLPAPYFENRISDGPNAADLLALAIGSNADASGHLLGRTGGFNYAVSGGDIDGGDRQDLTRQINAYLERVNDQADPDALYFVFAGGNDLRGLRSITSSDAATAEIARIVATLNAQLKRLEAAGARAFLVPNVANIGRLPETISREIGEMGIIARAERYTREYNQALTEMLAEFNRRETVSLVEFDLFTEFESLIENASALGFTRTDAGCFTPDPFIIELDCLLLGFGTRVFFDQLHPSSASNRIIAEQLVKLLPEFPTSTEQDPPQQTMPILAPILLLLFDEP